MFSKTDIARYYDLSEVHYRMFWDLERSRSLHYGYWDSTTANFHEALLHTNEILSGYAAITKEDRVLDAGCGIGGSSLWLARTIGCKVTGISLSANQVAQGNAAAKAEGLDGLAGFEVRDFTNTGFPDGSFDVIWGVESICHAPDKKLFLAEAYRLLSKSGRLVMADFFRQQGLQGRDAEQVRQWAHGWAIDDFATEEDFRRQLGETGFNTLKFENATSAIIRSAKRLYHAWILGWIPTRLYWLFNPKASSFGRKNVDTAYLQYVTLKRDLWKYMIVLAEKS